MQVVQLKASLFRLEPQLASSIQVFVSKRMKRKFKLPVAHISYIIPFVISASYYYLTIIRGLSEDTLKKKRLAFFLLPIATGLAFAFAGMNVF